MPGPGLDAALAVAINHWAASNFLTRGICVFAADYLVYLLGLAALAPWLRAWAAGRRIARRHCSWRMPLSAAVATALAALANFAVSLAYFRPRPGEAWPAIHELVASPLTPYSFPSTHSAAAFAVAFTVVLFHRRYGLWLMAVAAAVALGRVAVGVHYPADALVGALVGMALAYLTARRFGADRCEWRAAVK
jgi:undecaprenyl-diphosphatase